MRFSKPATQFVNNSILKTKGLSRIQACFHVRKKANRNDVYDTVQFTCQKGQVTESVLYNFTYFNVKWVTWINDIKILR